MLSRTKKSNTLLGKEAEASAAKYLVSQGCTILSTNYRYGRDEIDIVALDGEFLVFVEVKSRSSAKFGYPEEAVSSAKARRIVHAAEQYILDMDWQGDIRFDIVSVQNMHSLLWIKNAF